MAFWEDWCKDRDRDCDSRCQKLAIWAAVVAVVAGVILVLVFAFAVVYPPKATADDAVLQRFALSPGTPSPANSTLSYNATVTLSLRNPNMYRSISYGPLGASFYFNGSRFDESATVPAFDHGARKTAKVRVTVGGVDRPVKQLSAAGVAEFAKEKEAGRFGVEVRLDTVMQYKGRKARCPVVVVCQLQLQLVDPDVAATAFQRTKCTILRAKMSGC